jgi:serine protease SohB
MLDFILDIARFALQAAVIVASALIIIAFLASLISKNKDSLEVKITNLNKRFSKLRRALQKNLLSKKEYKKLLKSEKNIKDIDPTKPTAFVLNFEGDIKASATEQLRQEITSVLMVATQKDQIVVCIESPGGMVHGYGLAASQLNRIKEKGIPLTACVDKVAASGGYMMASVANKIIAAPFAIIGSIGVVASVPNFNKILKKNDVDYLEITAGEHKRTLTPLGEITEQGMKKFKEQIEEVHVLFKNHISSQRPSVDITKVSTGEYWYGSQAKGLNLIDELGTSDDYLYSLSETHNVLKVTFEGKKSLKEKLAESMSLSLEKLFSKAMSLIWSKRYEH